MKSKNSLGLGSDFARNAHPCGIPGRPLKRGVNCHLSAIDLHLA